MSTLWKGLVPKGLMLPSPADEADRAYAEDLDERIQRIIDARVATRVGGLGGGAVVLWLLRSFRHMSGKAYHELG